MPETVSDHGWNMMRSFAGVAPDKPVMPPEAQTQDIDYALIEHDVTRAAQKHILGESATAQAYVVPMTNNTDSAQESVRSRGGMREVQLPPLEKEQQ